MSCTVERFITGPIETNTYVILNESRQCCIIDPSSGCDEVIAFVNKEQLVPQAIVITHGHFDHIVGIPEIVKHFPSLVTYIHPDERSTLTNPMHNMSVMLGMSFRYDGAAQDLTEGTFIAGGFSGTVYCIPGHSRGGCALLLEKFLFCGDILFASAVGRTDFPGGDHDALVNGIRKKLLPLDDGIIVCPGHLGRTTIGRERKHNPFLQG